MVPPVPPPDRVDAALDRIESWVDDAPCPGASVAVVDESGVIAARGVGQRRRDPDRPATPETLYAVGSIAKPVTALATLLLAERGRFDLADSVAEYVPYFEGAPGDPVTVGQLLSHASGMPNADLAFAADEFDGCDDFEAAVAETTDRRRTDRDRFCYYNTGYAVLDRLVTAVSGTDFPEFVEREVFEPLGMDTATFDRSVVGDETADAMAPFVREDGDLRPASPSENPITNSDLLRAPGGLVASVTDLGRFLGALIGSEGPFAGGTAERLRTPVVTRERYVDGTELAYGYGLEVDPFGDETLVGHGGNTGFSGGYVGMLEGAGVGIAVGCTGVGDPRGAARDALAVLSDQDPEAVDPAAGVDEAMATLVGEYETPSGNHGATVSREEGCLRVAFGGDVESFEKRFLPTDLADTPYEFTDADCAESTTDAEFFPGDPPELLFEGMLFWRAGARREVDSSVDS